MPAFVGRRFPPIKSRRQRPILYSPKVHGAVMSAVRSAQSIRLLRQTFEMARYLLAIAGGVVFGAMTWPSQTVVGERRSHVSDAARAPISNASRSVRTRINCTDLLSDQSAVTSFTRESNKKELWLNGHGTSEAAVPIPAGRVTIHSQPNWGQITAIGMPHSRSPPGPMPPLWRHIPVT